MEETGHTIESLSKFTKISNKRLTAILDGKKKPRASECRCLAHKKALNVRWEKFAFPNYHRRNIHEKK